MEDKSYIWFLSECCVKKARLNILETGICRGSLLLDWYFTDQSNTISRKPKKDLTKTKHLLSHFLNHLHPVLEQYNPDKVICYLYHRTGVKVVTSKEIIDLAENQLHGLQVRSIHMALQSSKNHYKAFRLFAWSEGSELCHKLTTGRISKPMTEELSDTATYEKVLSIVLYISDFITKACFKNINRLKLDLVADSHGEIFIVKIVELSLDESARRTEAIIRNLARRQSLKQHDDSSEDISKEEEEDLAAKEIRKKNTEARLSLKKNAAQNSPVFLEMIAKTIERERKAQEVREKMINKKMMIENGFASNHKTVFQIRSLKGKSYYSERQVINSFSDLLYFVEKTRPRVWIKDVADDKGLEIEEQRNLEVRGKKRLCFSKGNSLVGTPVNGLWNSSKPDSPVKVSHNSKASFKFGNINLCS